MNAFKNESGKRYVTLSYAEVARYGGYLTAVVSLLTVAFGVGAQTTLLLAKIDSKAPQVVVDSLGRRVSDNWQTTHNTETLLSVLVDEVRSLKSDMRDVKTLACTDKPNDSSCKRR